MDEWKGINLINQEREIMKYMVQSSFYQLNIHPNTTGAFLNIINKSFILYHKEMMIKLVLRWATDAGRNFPCFHSQYKEKKQILFQYKRGTARVLMLSTGGVFLINLWGFGLFQIIGKTKRTSWKCLYKNNLVTHTHTHLNRKMPPYITLQI